MNQGHHEGNVLGVEPIDWREIPFWLVIERLISHQNQKEIELLVRLPGWSVPVEEVLKPYEAGGMAGWDVDARGCQVGADRALVTVISVKHRAVERPPATKQFGDAPVPLAECVSAALDDVGWRGTVDHVSVIRGMPSAAFDNPYLRRNANARSQWGSGSKSSWMK